MLTPATTPRPPSSEQVAAFNRNAWPRSTGIPGRNRRNPQSINTKAELIVRKAAHGLGYRFRLYRKELPGRPDLVFPSRRVALFVNGCFWHRHALCRRATTPKSRTDFWEDKFCRTVERDERAAEALKALGWRVSVIWECQTLRRNEVERLLRRNVGRYPVRWRRAKRARPVKTSCAARLPNATCQNNKRNKGQ
jgi:DNA mismatch endonuclease (patch repair protein)